MSGTFLRRRDTITPMALVIVACLHGTSSTAISQGCIPAPPGMVSWHPGDGNAIDIVNGHHGSLEGGATYAAGKVSMAFDLTAGGARVRVPDHDDWTLGANPFTIDLWARFDGVPPRASLVGHDDGPGGQRKWIFWYDALGHRAPFGPALRFHINGGGLPPLDPVVFPWTPQTGRWYHLAVTRSKSTYSLYIDGVSVITETDANAIPNASSPLYLGWSEGNYYFNGLIDEVEIFHRALDPGEIQALFDADSFGKCRPPVSVESNSWGRVKAEYR